MAASCNYLQLEVLFLLGTRRTRPSETDGGQSHGPKSDWMLLPAPYRPHPTANQKRQKAGK